MPLEPQLLTGFGAALSIFLTAAGAAFGTAHSGIYAVRGTSYKDFVPVVQSGVLAIYGIIVSVIMVGKFNEKGDNMTQTDGYRYLAAGLTVGLACWVSGWGIGKFVQQINEAEKPVATAATGATSEQTEPLIGRPAVATFTAHRPDFRKTVMVLIFLEAIGLYGLIVSLLLMG